MLSLYVHAPSFKSLEFKFFLTHLRNCGHMFSFNSSVWEFILWTLSFKLLYK